MLPVPSPAGDAAGMRNAASQLRGRADRLAAVIRRLESETGSMTYAGPAADRFRSNMSFIDGQLAQVLQRMTEAAEILVRGAAEVEAKAAAQQQGQPPGSWS